MQNDNSPLLQTLPFPFPVLAISFLSLFPLPFLSFPPNKQNDNKRERMTECVCIHEKERDGYHFFIERNRRTIMFVKKCLNMLSNL